MANFKIGENGQDISSFDIPCGREVKLVQWGGDAEGNRLELGFSDNTAGFSLAPYSTKMAAASTLFGVRGDTPNSSVRITACVAGSNRSQHYAKPLQINCRGTPRNHAGYEVDLIANLAMNGNAKQIQSYSDIVDQNRGNCAKVLSQNVKTMNCGDTARDYGKNIFGVKTFQGIQKYYLPAKSDKMKELKFNSKVVGTGILRIKTLLSKGQPVWLWCVHHDGFRHPEITAHHPAHYVTAVGYSGNKILYIDPWPGGSRLTYDGGMYPKQSNEHLGELIFNPSKPGEGLKTDRTGGSFQGLYVIAGP
jgi:uncharacterized protein YvpB